MDFSVPTTAQQQRGFKLVPLSSQRFIELASLQLSGSSSCSIMHFLRQLEELPDSAWALLVPATIVR